MAKVLRNQNHRFSMHYQAFIKMYMELNLRVDEQIFGLYITMNDVASMAERYSLNHLINVVAETFWVNANCIFFQHLKQVLFYVFEYQIETPFPIKP